MKKFPAFEKMVLNEPKAKAQPSEKNDALVRGYLMALSMRGPA